MLHKSPACIRQQRYLKVQYLHNNRPSKGIVKTSKELVATSKVYYKTEVRTW